MTKIKSQLRANIVFLIIMLSVVGLATYYIVNTDYAYSLNPRSAKHLYQMIQEAAPEFGIYEYDMAMGKGEDYSTTNIQVDGVDESDIIKTDGDYIYVVDHAQIFIVEPKDMEVVTTIKLSDHVTSNSYRFIEAYIQNNRLVVITEGGNYYNRYNMFDSSYLQEVGVLTFDVSDKSNVSLVSKNFQSGSYSSSRVYDDYLYLVSNYYVSTIKEFTPETYIPKLNNETLPLDDIYIMPIIDSPSYAFISSINIKTGEKHSDAKAVLAGNTQMYMNDQSLYLVTSGNKTENEVLKSTSDIMKFTIDNGAIDFVNTTEIDGYLLNQFAMDEYKDEFRLVTTSYTYKVSGNDNDVSVSISEDNRYSNVYILDKNLKVIDHLPNIAPTEVVYSVRFQKDIVYFVTFRQVDPLFAVSLNNQKITMLSSLKLPGFSDYLHLYDDNLLLGLGHDANDKGAVTGLKLTMFDITDNRNVTVANDYIIDDVNVWSSYFYNHKSILINKEKDLIGFPSNNNYLIFGYQDDFILKADLKTSENIYGEARGLFIDNEFYVVSKYNVDKYDLETFNFKNSLLLQDDNFDRDKIYY